MISLPTRITVNFMGNTKVYHAYTATPKKLVKFRALFLKIIYIYIYCYLASRTGAKRRVPSCSERWRHRKRAPTKLLQQLSRGMWPWLRVNHVNHVNQSTTLLCIFL